jgi:hypothetical protein
MRSRTSSVYEYNNNSNSNEKNGNGTTSTTGADTGQSTNTRRKRKYKHKSIHSHVTAARPVVLEPLDPEHFPQQFELFAADVATFLKSLTEFPEFSDEGVEGAIVAFEVDLRVSIVLMQSLPTIRISSWMLVPSVLLEGF